MPSLESSSVQNSAAAVAIVPLETQAAFWPLITHSSPSRRARQLGRTEGSLKMGSVKPTWSLP